MYIAPRTLVSQNLASASSQLPQKKAYYESRKYMVGLLHTKIERERVAQKTTKVTGKEDSRIKGQKTIGGIEKSRECIEESAFRDEEFKAISERR